MMERILFVVLLLSECCILSTCLLRQYHFVDKNLTWTEAQTYCRQTYTDLATVENDEEMNQLINTVSSAGYNSDFWIGLFTEIDWRWSDGFTGNGADYRNWEISLSEPNFYMDEFCVAYKDDGKWYDFYCTRPFPFICYNGTQLDPEFMYVNEALDWSGAQRYCRENHVDLATVRNHEENQRVQSLMPSGVFAMIGLFRDPNIYWSDGSNFSFISLHYDPNPISAMRVMCGRSMSSFNSWKFVPCENKSRFVCYSLPSEKQQVVKLRLKLWDSGSNPAVIADLLKKLQDRLKKNGVTGVTLKWREQPDGKVFHKERKRKMTEL